MEIKDFITGKVRFDNYSDGAIFDEENNHIADVRGWGRLSKDLGDDKAVELQDFAAKWIAEAINEKLQNDRVKEEKK